MSASAEGGIQLDDVEPGMRQSAQGRDDTVKLRRATAVRLGGFASSAAEAWTGGCGRQAPNLAFRSSHPWLGRTQRSAGHLVHSNRQTLVSEKLASV